MIDERKLLDDLENWKNNLSGADTFQDETLKLFIDVFRKKVEAQPKVTEFQIIDVVMKRIKEREKQLQEDEDYLSGVKGVFDTIKIQTRINEIGAIQEIINAAVVEFIEADDLEEPEEATHEAIFESNWKESMMKHFAKGE